jgi:hypothetical protein
MIQPPAGPPPCGDRAVKLRCIAPGRPAAPATGRRHAAARRRLDAGPPARRALVTVLCLEWVPYPDIQPPSDWVTWGHMRKRAPRTRRTSKRACGPSTKRAPEELGPFAVILRQPVRAAAIHVSEVNQRVCVPLVGGDFEVVRALGVVCCQFACGERGCILPLEVCVC